MDAVSAVVTTGIYCRPGCPARPRLEHVREFPLAAAAEAAGYRACLRCRPYRSPPVVPWAGPELVCRAVQLILDGALDRGTEADLGARLGISARHLRRLFMTSLGVTPDGLARSARAHFARRLLDDTDLGLAEVAFAAGFGSVRQFNRACREVFREPPRVLRARRRARDRLAADGGLCLRLPYHGPLDWDGMLRDFAAHAIPGVEHVANGVYRRTIVLGGDPGVLELLPGGHDHLVLRAHLPHWEELVHVAQRARHIANLDCGPRPRPPGTWDAFETAVQLIVGQQVGLANATSIVGRLVERLGQPVAGLRPLGLSRTFPPAEVVATADLSGLGLTGASQHAVRAFAGAVDGEAIRLDRSVGLERLIASITAIAGVEPRTAHSIARRLGEPGARPATAPVRRLA